MEPADALEALRVSDLLCDDYPKRSSPSAGTAAMERTPEFRPLVDLVRGLGTSGYAPAVPLLSRLWTSCPLVPVRNAAGHALRAIGTPESYSALESLIDEPDYVSVTFAARAVFDADPMSAFDRCAERFQQETLRREQGVSIATAILRIFCPTSFRYADGQEIPAWREARAPEWFHQDRRWLHLCIDFRHHEALGPVARMALRYADKAMVDDALAVALDERPRKEVKPVTTAPGDLLARYKRGAHAEVWRELRAHGAVGGALRDEATEVAQETMRRAGQALDQLAERLAAAGWSSLEGPFRTPFGPKDADAIREIEKRTTSELPMSLRAFWEVVGGADLVWNYNSEGGPPSLGVDLPMDEMDPLSISPARECRYLFSEWEEARAGVHPELMDPFNLDLAPDALHKANISGGAPYGIELPFVGVDAVFGNSEYGLPLVEYLRECVRWGGFPRLARYDAREDVLAFVERMTDGIEPF